MKVRILKRLKKVVAAALVLCMSYVALPVPTAKAIVAVSDVIINEIMPNGVVPTTETDEFIEIYNKGTSTIDLAASGLYLTESAGAPPAIYNLTGTLAPGTFASYTRSQTGIQMANGGETVYLKDATTTLDSVTYGAAAEGYSYARKPDGTGPFVWDSTPTSGLTNNTGPTTPTNPSPAYASYVADNTPTFGWSSSTDPDGDTIEYVLSLTGSEQTPGSGALDESFTIGGLTSYTHGTLIDGTYTWKVKACDPYNSNSAWSDSWSFTIDTTPPFVGPATASPNPFSPNGDGVKDASTISYTLTEASEVDIRIYDSSNTLVRTLVNNYAGTVGDNSNTWDGKNDSPTSAVVPDGNYTAEIIASDLAGNGSNTVVANITVDTTAPQGTYQSVLNTTNPTNDNNPDVSGKCYECGTSQLAQAVAPGVVTSDIAKIEVRYEPIIQNGVANLNATGTPSYYWKNGVMDGSGGYTTDDEDGFSSGYITTLSAKRFLIPNGVLISSLPDGGYKVSSVSSDLAGNEKTETFEDNLIIDIQKPTTPMNLIVTGKTDESISLSWDASTDTGSGVSGYKVLAGTSPGVYTKTLDVGDVTNCIVIGLDADTLYYFTVVAYDKAMNESERSIEVSAKTDDAIENLLSLNSFQEPGTQVLGSNTGDQNSGGGETKGEEKKDDGGGDTQVLAWYWWLLLILLLGGGIYVGQKYWPQNQK